jgi:hypothetical protein
LPLCLLEAATLDISVKTNAKAHGKEAIQRNRGRAPRIGGNARHDAYESKYREGAAVECVARGKAGHIQISINVPLIAAN